MDNCMGFLPLSLLNLSNLFSAKTRSRSHIKQLRDPFSNVNEACFYKMSIGIVY